MFYARGLTFFNQPTLGPILKMPRLNFGFYFLSGVRYYEMIMALSRVYIGSFSF